MAHYRSSSDLGNLTADCEVVRGDIRDERCVENAISGCDCVVHLAALIDVPYSSVAPRSYLDTNLGGVFNILESCRKHQIPLVATSSSEVYGSAEYTPIDENHRLYAQSPYAASKIAADQFCNAYRRCYSLPIVILRPFNTYGPRQSERAVLPSIIKQLLRGPRVEIGNVQAKRDWLFIEDSCRGYVKAIEYLHSGGKQEIFNLATGRPISVLEAIRRIADSMRITPNIIENQARLRPGESEIMILQGDWQKAEALLNWEPRVSFTEGIIETIEWYRNRP